MTHLLINSIAQFLMEYLTSDRITGRYGRFQFGMYNQTTDCPWLDASPHFCENARNKRTYQLTGSAQS